MSATCRPSASPPWSLSGGRWMQVAPDFDEFIGCLTAHGVESRAKGRQRPPPPARPTDSLAALAARSFGFNVLGA